MHAPDPNPPKDVTALLQRHRGGDAAALQDLLERTYDELRVLSRRAFGGQQPGQTLQPTALLHEAWLKLGGKLDAVSDRQHFFALAARAMRQVLTDHARARSSQKRGGGVRSVTLHDDSAGGFEGDDLVALDEVLERLSAFNERHARVVELRVFGGLTIAETAAALEVATSTVESDWAMARAWLRSELAP